MTIDVFTATGEKKGTQSLPAALFEAPINHGLMHQAVMLQQGNRRASTAHAKSRGEVQGSSAKLFAQKGTGRARRGSIRSPLLRGGGKAFGPKKTMNYTKDMPKAMRRAALFSCLSLQAKHQVIIGLENYPDTVKTKDMHTLLAKLPVELGRSLLFVLPEKHRGLVLSARNIPGVKVILASYLNPEDVLHARKIIFVADAVAKAEAVFGKRTSRVKVRKDADDSEESEDAEEKGSRMKKRDAAKRSTTKKSAKPKAKSSESAASSAPSES